MEKENITENKGEKNERGKEKEGMRTEGVERPKTRRARRGTTRRLMTQVTGRRGHSTPEGGEELGQLVLVFEQLLPSG